MLRYAGVVESGYLIDDMYVEVIADGMHLPDRTAFAGSVATADRLVRAMVQIAGVPMADAVKMMTLTPAKVMGIDGRLQIHP